MQSNDDSYPHTFNNIHLSALTLYLLKSYTCLLVLKGLCPDCEPRARQSTTELCAPTVSLVPASLSFLWSLVLPLWVLCPLAYYLHSFNLWFIRRSYQWIDALVPKLWFTRWSSQLLDALVCKPQFIRWSPQSLTPWYLNLRSFY